jgi:hypothetical protein
MGPESENISLNIKGGERDEGIEFILCLLCSTSYS